MTKSIKKKNIAIVGEVYVGLPLSMYISKDNNIDSVDIDKEKLIN